MTLRAVKLRCNWYKKKSSKTFTAPKMSKCGVFAGPYFPVFSPNTEKCGWDKTPYLDASYAVFMDR